MAPTTTGQTLEFRPPADMAEDPQKISLRGRIAGKKQAGMSVAAIAEDEGVSQTTVKKWWRKWQAEGDLRDHPRSGRPRKTTPDDDRRIIGQATRTPIISAVQIRNQLQLQVSRQTICKRLHEDGVHHRIPAEKEMLTERHRNRRLLFAQQHVNEGLDVWGRVIFSDEKTFSSTTHGRPHCWRRNGTRYSRENIYEVARSGHVTCNVWGWVHLYGVGELVHIDGRLTAAKYIEILEEVMVPTVRAMATPYPERIIFMQDNCPVHTARIVSRWFRDQPDIDLLPWPAKAADLNPVENCWGMIVNTWQQGQERTPHALVQHTMHEWERLRGRQGDIYDTVASLPSRLQEVIDNDGGWTHY